MRALIVLLLACGCSTVQIRGVDSASDECSLTPVIHVLQYPGCVPKPIPSFACIGKCGSYVQVRTESNNWSKHNCRFGKSRKGRKDNRKIIFLFQVSGSKIWQMERSCNCCQESGEREASVSLFCPKAKAGERKFRKVSVASNFLFHFFAFPRLTCACLEVAWDANWLILISGVVKSKQLLVVKLQTQFFHWVRLNQLKTLLPYLVELKGETRASESMLVRQWKFKIFKTVK